MPDHFSGDGAAAWHAVRGTFPLLDEVVRAGTGRGLADGAAATSILHLAEDDDGARTLVVRLDDGTFAVANAASGCNWTFWRVRPTLDELYLTFMPEDFARLGLDVTWDAWLRDVASRVKK